MATVGVTLSNRDGNAPSLVSEGRGEAITSSGTSAQSTLTAGQYEYWTITASGNAIWVEFGANPTAASGTSWLLANGASREWRATPGDKVAVIDA